MQYLVSVITDELTVQADEAEMKAIHAFNERLQRDGHWVFAGGLADPSSSTVVDGRGEAHVVTDGPFLESKEFLIGFWIMRADDLDAILELATEGSNACNRRLEVRPIL